MTGERLMTKACTKCKLEFNVETGYYYSKKLKRFDNHCRYCHMDLIKRWRALNPDKRNRWRQNKKSK